MEATTELIASKQLRRLITTMIKTTIFVRIVGSIYLYACLYVRVFTICNCTTLTKRRDDKDISDMRHNDVTTFTTIGKRFFVSIFVFSTILKYACN